MASELLAATEHRVRVTDAEAKALMNDAVAAEHPLALAFGPTGSWLIWTDADPWTAERLLEIRRAAKGHN